MTAPLEGTLVLDASRMLPGAVLARSLLDLGARVIKVEDPSGGDPMRGTPPLVDGMGAGFARFFAGAESVCLDLRSKDGAAAFRKLAKQADVVVESFRPGTLGRWGLGPERLLALNGSLVVCSLPSFGAADPKRIAHDLNIAALSGLLHALGFSGESIPGVQIADVTTGLLATSAILAALLSRHRTGRGMHLEQPLSASPLPFLAWALADAARGEVGVLETVLGGRTPAYGVYTCADGKRLALGAIEPKFWVEMVTAAGLPDLAGDGLDGGARGAEARRRLAARLAEKPRAEWLKLAADRDLPLTPVNSVAEAMNDPLGAPVRAFLPAFAPAARGSAPALGAETKRVLAEFGVPTAGTT